MDPALAAHARATIGFMPEDEGAALYEAALTAPPGPPLLEVGSYCGKSAIYLGAAARALGTVLYSIDHHRGSEEHQPGEEYHDPSLTDESGLVDTLPTFRRTIQRAGLEDTVVALVGPSRLVATHWRTPLATTFIDGGHSRAAAHGDYEGWAPHVVREGLLIVHDVFEDPRDGGRPPFEIVTRALQSGAFVEVRRAGSLRVLQRVADGI